MSDLSIDQAGDEVLIRAGDTVIAEYHATADVEPVNTPKSFFHPLRTLSGAVVTGFAPDDHPWHHGLQFAFPRVGEHNLWGGGTFFDLDRGYEVVDDQGSIRHDSWGAVDQLGESASFTQQLTWLGHGEEVLLAERRRVVVSLRHAGESPAWVLDFFTTLTNATDAPISLETPAQRGRPDGGYGGLFLRLAHEVQADRLVGDSDEVTESGAQSRTLVIQGHTEAGEPITLGLSYLDPAARGAQKWLYRFAPQPFSAVGWASAYDDGLDLGVDESISFAHRLVVADGTLDPADVRGLL